MRSDADERPSALLPCAALSVCAVALVSLRAALTGRTGFYFLIWNLTLAWIPALCGRLFAMAARRGRRGFAALAGVAWLAFLPNTFYVVTDVVHLRGAYGERMIYDGACVALFAGVSWLLGLTALDDVVRPVSRRFGGATGVALVLAASVLSGFGVYLGRFLRFNSWDVLTRPGAVVGAIGDRALHPTAHPHAVMMTTLFGALVAATCFADQLRRRV